MKKLLRLCCFTTIPFLALRTWDLLTNIDYRTGFFVKSGWFRHILILLTLCIMIAFLYFSARRRSISARPTTSFPTGALFALAGSGILVGSYLLLRLSLLRAGQFSNLWISKKALLHAGYYSTHFRTEFWCALTGFVAAAWFIWAAVRFFRGGGDLSVRPVFSCIPIAWYCFRAFLDYSYSPINPNNTLVFACLMSDLLIGLALYRLLRHAVSDYPDKSTSLLAPFAAAAFIFVIAFKLPIIGIPYAQHEAADKIYILADAFAAAGVCAAVDTLLGRTTDEAKNN